MSHDGEERIRGVRVVRPDQWSALPIQPPAGYWWRLTRRLSVAFLSALGVMASLAICSVTGARPPEWLISVALAAIVAPAVAVIILCVIAARPYKAERRLGYTTWPSVRELARV
ncbi:hypothetical protein ABLI39_00170 [Pseudarthrobacter sp. B907]|uniref:hypothetical protein n=1 Tax=Pseudarthrobacter sp. B907 TaxID=3158261 RepID=UPI0032DB8488